MTNDSADVYKDMCAWWLRKARNLKRQGTPASLEVLHCVEALEFPTEAATAPLWCVECIRALPVLQDAPTWFRPLQEKWQRWADRLETPPLANTSATTPSGALDALLAGEVSLDEAVQLLEVS